MALFHGAGSNARAALMVAVAEAFSKDGWLVFRGDLPYRQERASGPPRGNGSRDREGIRRAAEELRTLAGGVPLCLAGHSYGGRQCCMLAAGELLHRGRASASLLPAAPSRTARKTSHRPFTELRTPALFVHGTRDAFGSIAEMESALKLIPARTSLVTIQGAPHGVPPSVAPTLPAVLWAIMNEAG